MIFSAIFGTIKSIIFIDQHSTHKKIFPSSFPSRMSSEDFNKSADNPDLRTFAEEKPDGKLQNVQNFP